MRTAALAVAMAITTWITTTSRSECAEVVCDTAVIKQAWDLLILARFGTINQERAAFITRDVDGNLKFLVWHYTNDFRRAAYPGPLPTDAVAIIHTHPNSVPYPSDDDVQLARRIGVPVYVITRTMISRTTGHGVERIWFGDWNPEQPGRDGRSICATSLGVADQGVH